MSPLILDTLVKRLENITINNFPNYRIIERREIRKKNNFLTNSTK